LAGLKPSTDFAEVSIVAAGGRAGKGRLPKPVRTSEKGLEKPARAVEVQEHAELSAREVEILGLMAQGLFNHEIAARLFLAQETVKTHIHHVLRKLGARSRTHAVSIALQEGLLASEARQPSVSHVTSVPFVDLGPAHAGLTGPIVGDVLELIESGQFTDGPAVALFEEAFAEYCGCAHAVGVASGLDALQLALLAAGIEPGDQVILPANTFAATIEAVVQAGGRPVLADVSESDYNLDPAAVEKALTPRTRFLLPVHLYGQMADLVAVKRIAERHGLAIVEDACQAHGARRNDRRAGAAGIAGAFSFYPSMNLGAFGDSGAVVTNDDEIAATVRALREHGQPGKYEHDTYGYTARLDTIQAVVLLRKLPFLDDWNQQRRMAAHFYQRHLTGVGDLVLPPVPPRSKPVWHLFCIRTAQPDRLARFLRLRAIGTWRHSPQPPPHLARAYGELYHRAGAFPVSEQLASEVLSLPIFPGIQEEQLAAVVDAIAAYFERG
jgi:dTDP-4-amino-4,6-dideoxygalactose transaminase/DNA-binding CsgD family transcriptional regulator